MQKHIKKFIDKKRGNSGFIFLEIIIGIALFSIVFTVLLGVGALALNVSHSVKEKIRADFLIKEEFEALRNFRNGTSWATNGLGAVNTGSGNPYHLANSLNSWALVPGVETVDIFTRQVVFDRVSRDDSQNIESIYNPLNDDLDTKKITITVVFGDKTIQAVSYLTNWRDD